MADHPLPPQTANQETSRRKRKAYDQSLVQTYGKVKVESAPSQGQDKTSFAVTLSETRRNLMTNVRHPWGDPLPAHRRRRFRRAPSNGEPSPRTISKSLNVRASTDAMALPADSHWLQQRNRVSSCLRLNLTSSGGDI
jgi:hypothetical protein